MRTFPKISPNPKRPDFGKHCKYQLVKFNPSNAWNNEAESNEMFINTYDYFLLTAENAEDCASVFQGKRTLGNCTIWPVTVMIKVMKMNRATMSKLITACGVVWNQPKLW